MIRILHSVSYMSRGGIETMLMNYYRNIDRTKVQFDFLCNSNLHGAYDEEILSMGGRIFRTPGFSPLKRRAYKKYMRELFEAHPEYQIVEAHNGPLGRYAMKAAKDSNIPIRIYHAHGADLRFDLKWPIKYYCMKMLKYSMNKHFVCSEKAGRFYMGDDVIDRGDFHFIPNAIAIENFLFSKTTRDNLRKEFHLEDKLVIGHIGRLSPQKNHKFILDTFAELHRINAKTHLVLVGDGEWHDLVVNKIKSLGLTENVTLTGSIPNPQDWYQAFDLFFMPSLWEGLPVTGVEAQASDLPCVFSSAVTQEVALTDKTEFISLDQPREYWVCRLNDIIMHLTPRRDMTSTITQKHYNIKEEAKYLQNLYLDFHEKAKQEC